VEVIKKSQEPRIKSQDRKAIVVMRFFIHDATIKNYMTNFFILTLDSWFLALDPWLLIPDSKPYTPKGA
jgi:hypothetical protein